MEPFHIVLIIVAIISVVVTALLIWNNYSLAKKEGNKDSFLGK